MRKNLILILLFVFSGCVPKIHTVIPKIEGKVIDIVTKKPIENVTIGSIKTNKDGKFSLDGKKELGIGTPMGGVWKLPTVMVPVSKKGYRNVYCQCSGLSNNIYGCTNVTIALTPLGENVLENIEKSTQNDDFSCQIVKRERLAK